MGYAGPVAVAVCTEIDGGTARRGRPPTGSDLQVDATDAHPERERAKERRRLVERRRDFVTTRLGSRLPRTAAVDLLIGALLDRANTNDAGKAGALLGTTAKPGRYGDDWHGALAELATRSEADRLRVGVAVAAAMAEARIASGGHRDGAARYVEFLCALGYEPEPDEAPPETRKPAPGTDPSES